MAPIIRTCSVAAFALALWSAPAAAKPDASSPLADYVAARMLEGQEKGAAAAQAYALALSGAPDNDRIAMRAYREAIEAGDRSLALRAAHALDAQQKLPQDARLLLIGESLSKGDWRGARLMVDKLEESGGFDFLIPALRIWTDLAARDASTLTSAARQPRDGLGSTYLREQQPLILLARKQVDDGLTAAKALTRPDGRGLILRLAVAARLVALKERAKALELLVDDSSTMQAARALVESGKPLPGAIDSPTAGTAFLIARIASDLLRDTGSSASLTFARIASFTAPDNDAIRMTLAQALANNGRTVEALTVLDGVAPLYGALVRDIRIGALGRVDRNLEALTLAQEAVNRPDADLYDHARLGGVLTKLQKPREAAAAYREAIRLAGSNAPWNLLLLYGGALDQAGQWAEAKPVLQSAVAAAPEEPDALNHLGYAMLEHGDDLAEATRLIAKASALRPDSAAITDSLGWAFYLRGQPDDSIPLLERAVAADPTEAAVGEHLGDAYWAAGRRVDARYAWRAALVQSEGADDIKRIEDKIANGLPARTK
ncbi:tetratricopeptide repeat protein [Aquisediminimonas profunda]|uniref:tetratricopeptide repeat protein n=1 Tax=Aquisediminimonas profunda TaxID=1550733 RepID=UPI001C624FFA|nr:tetratricopeptide repeat protein [Aquisediminimonas profunda]